MEGLQEFAVSSNGDRWFLEKGVAGGQDFILHRGNPSSGGHETRISVDAFLAQTPVTPEREALITILDADSAPNAAGVRDDEKTPSLKLAEEYLRLGGQRRAKVDDNIVSTRKWEDESPEAAAFWRENVEPMDEKRRQEVEVHLPSISDV